MALPVVDIVVLIQNDNNTSLFFLVGLECCYFGAYELLPGNRKQKQLLAKGGRHCGIKVTVYPYNHAYVLKFGCSCLDSFSLTPYQLLL